MYVTFTENSFLFYNVLNQKFQKIHPTVHSLKYKLTVKILKLRNQKVPFLHPTHQLHTRSANSSETHYFLKANLFGFGLTKFVCPWEKEL